MPKGSAKGEAGALRRRSRFVTVLAVQTLLALLLLGAAAFTWEDRQTARLYAWSALIPAGFAAVFTASYRRGERERTAGSWTLAWERAEAKRAYRLLGAVLIVWAVGVAAFLLL